MPTLPETAYAQIVLPLSHRQATGPAGGAANTQIVVGNANAAAAEALQKPHNWPFGTAVLSGASRSGKTLFSTWFARSNAGTGGGEAIDDADQMDETALFHRWNRAQERGTPLLLTAQADDWHVTLPDLRSRIGAALHLHISTPDDAMLADLMEFHARQCGLALGEGALTYLVPRTERSFAGVERLIAQIDRLTLERKVAATLSVWRDALEAARGPEQARLF